jgi:hypothetical protein
MKHLLWISALLVVLALPSAVYGVQDPCALTVKSSTMFGLNAGGLQQVIPGVTSKHIYVCNVVFSGSATAGGFNINFAGSSSGCSSDFTFLGSLNPNNNVVVSAGGGSSTQFNVPANDSFCIGLAGSGTLYSSGWVVYVQR